MTNEEAIENLTNSYVLTYGKQPDATMKTVIESCATNATPGRRYRWSNDTEALVWLEGHPINP